MEMWLQSAILALIAVAGATLVPHSVIRLDLDATEKKGITVFPGSSLNLHCCINTNISQRCRVAVYFEPFEKNQSEANTNPICNWTETTNCNLDNVCNTFSCPLSKLDEANNGLYYCKVTIEIPTLYCINSTKNKVMVENFKEKTTVQSQTAKTQVVSTDDVHDNWWMWALVGSSCLILIILPVIFVVRKRPCNRSQGEEPIYVNTRMGKPSPQLMPTDNLKAVSCSKDIQTPSSVRRYEDRNQRYKH